MKINGSAGGMTHQEYEYLQSRKTEMKRYRMALIADILKNNTNFFEEQLIRKPLRTLEIMACC